MGSTRSADKIKVANTISEEQGGHLTAPFSPSSTIMPVVEDSVDEDGVEGDLRAYAEQGEQRDEHTFGNAEPARWHERQGRNELGHGVDYEQLPRLHLRLECREDEKET